MYVCVYACSGLLLSMSFCVSVVLFYIFLHCQVCAKLPNVHISNSPVEFRRINNTMSHKINSKANFELWLFNKNIRYRCRCLRSTRLLYSRDAAGFNYLDTGIKIQSLNTRFRDVCCYSNHLLFELRWVFTFNTMSYDLARRWLYRSDGNNKLPFVSGIRKKCKFSVQNAITLTPVICRHSGRYCIS